MMRQITAGPGGQRYETEGRCEGMIGYAERGTHGFGYDPLFFVQAYDDCTMAELDMATKNRISHRATALAEMLPVLHRLAVLS